MLYPSLLDLYRLKNWFLLPICLPRVLDYKAVSRLDALAVDNVLIRYSILCVDIEIMRPVGSIKSEKWPATHFMCVRKNTSEFLSAKCSFNLVGIRGAIGYIFGSNIPIIAPQDNEFAYVNGTTFAYVNRTNQRFCDANLSFADIAAKWPGLNHQYFKLQNSRICDDFKTCNTYPEDKYHVWLSIKSRMRSRLRRLARITKRTVIRMSKY